MEGSHGQLGTGFADCLSRDDTDRFADVDEFLTRRKVGTVAVRADALLCVALNDGSDIHLVDSRFFDRISLRLGDHGIVGNDDLAGRGIDHVADGEASDDTLLERFQNVFAVHNPGNPCALLGVALDLADDDLLRDVHKTSGQVTGVCGTQSGIGQGLTRRTRAHEIFEDFHTLAEVGLDRDFHRLTVGREHRSAHCGKLTHLLHGTTRTGVCHDLDRVVLTEDGFELVGDFARGLVPQIDDASVTFLFGKKSALTVFVDGIHLLLCLSKNLRLFGRDVHVVH